MRTACVLGTLLLLGLGGAPRAQEPPLPSREDLLAQLADPELAIEKKHELLRRWLLRHARGLDEGERLRFELRYAVLTLGLRRADEALALFEGLERRIGERDDALRELSARCRLGLAQAHELGGRKREAIRIYLQVVQRWPRTRYERVARQALRRLQSESRAFPEQPLGLLQQAQRIDGERILPPAQGAWLVVFLPDASGTWPDALAALQKPGPGASARALRLTVFVPGDERAARSARRRLQAIAAQPQIELEVVPWPHGLEERVQEELGFTTLPVWALVDGERRVRLLLPCQAEIDAAR